MTKHCTVCNQDYADDLTACPNCAAVTQKKLAGRGQERATQVFSRGDERSTRLAAEGPEDEIEAEVVELSDAPQPLEHPSDSTVDLGGSPAEVVGGDSEVVMAELASNTNPVDLVSDSAVNLAEDKGAADRSSTVNLGALPAQSGEGSSAEEAGSRASVADASGIDMEEAATLAASSDSDLHPSSGSDIDIGKEGPATPASGIDVAEERRRPASVGDMDLDSMQSEALGGEPTVEEPAVSEEEVNDLLAGLEETPAGSATAQEAAEIAEGEEAVAAAEAEEAAEAAEAEEEEKPAKAAKPRSPILALAGSALAGVLVGAGGLMGVQAMMGSGDKPKPLSLPNMSQPNAAAPAPVTFEMQAARVENGDWDEAQKAGIDQVQGANAKELAALGEYHMGSYLKSAGAKINTKDQKMQSAIQNLQKAADQKDPNGLYYLAFIKEVAGQLPEARADYAKGAQTFANDPTQKQRFDAAILRVEWKMSLKEAGAALIPLPQRMEDHALVLALLLVALQEQPAPSQSKEQSGQQPAQAAQAEKQEAGFEFWQAAKLARDGKFNEAIRAIDRARKLHDERRFSRLRKAQNPLSDPAEDIFLRCCDELKMYWQLENRLREGGYLTDKNTPPEALQALIQKAQGGDAMVKELTEKLMAAQTSQKEAQTTIADLQKKLQAASAKSAPPDGDLKAKEKMLAERDTALAAAKKENENLKSANNDLNTTLGKIRDELAAAKKEVDVARDKDARSEARPPRQETKPSSPPLNRPDSPRTLNPIEAEKHFAAGLNFYFDRDYANAEKEFLLTIENDSQDARFFYFLGLSRLAQNHRRDAFADFTQGVVLERLNRPSPAAVSESLERIQGPTRRLVNGFREMPQR
ncbi:MAG TPA: hypothetical protein VMF69_17865 [Gemmataceae bacterium]|nr:hypothetical protein [Gemmataceae bacterium]